MTAFGEFGQTQQFTLPINADNGIAITPGRVEGIVPTQQLAAEANPRYGERQSRAALAILDNPKDIFIFHYNPTEYEETTGADWVPKRYIQQNPSLEFAASLDTQIKCRLLLNDYLPGDGNQQFNVDQAIAWLRSTTIAEGNRGLQSAAYAETAPRDVNRAARRAGRRIKLSAPPVLVLLRGLREPFPCLLKDIKIRETYFETRTTRPIRAEVDIVLVGASGAVPGYNPQTRQFTISGRVRSGSSASID